MTREERSNEKHKDFFEEQNKEKIKNTVKKIVKVLLIISTLSALFFSYTTYISTAKITIREYRIKNKKIPSEFNGFKIIHFSDLHYGTTMSENNLLDIKKKINIRKPDIIVFTGDLINKNYKMTSKDNDILIKELKKLNASLGKYAIIGDEDDDTLLTIFNQADFTILKNESELIYKNTNNPILLVGLSSLINNEQDIEKAFNYFDQESSNPNIYTITMVHEPDSTDEILNYYATDIILSGHSHNGYIRLPFTKYSFFKSNGAKKYDQDYYKIKDTKLFISGGLGTNNKSGLRLFCRPSINLYRLSNK